MKLKTINYSDELNDDFAGTKKRTAETPPDYKYLRTNVIWNIIAFILYYFIARPIAYVASKLRYGTVVKGRKKLRQAKRSGYFMYGNHTLFSGDAFHPNLVAFPRRTHIIVGAEAVSIRGIKSLVAMLGGIPLPSTKGGYVRFMGALRHYISRKRAIMIYPEAHIWPYYTGIRPFGNGSFLYPITMNVPVFAVTTVFKRRKIRKLPKVKIYIDGPFYPDSALTIFENKRKLRDDVYNAMCERIKESEECLYSYIKAV